MKNTKITMGIICLIFAVSFLLCCSSEYIRLPANWNLLFFRSHRIFFQNIMIGIFSGSFLSAITLWISYKNEKKNTLSELINVLTEIESIFQRLDENISSNPTAIYEMTIKANAELKSKFDMFYKSIIKYSPFMSKRGIKQELLDFYLLLGDTLFELDSEEKSLKHRQIISS